MILYAICLSHSKWVLYIAPQKSIPGEHLGKVFRESWSIVVFTTQMNKSYRSEQWNWQHMGSMQPASWYCAACEKASIPKMFVKFSSCLERLERCWCFWLLFWKCLVQIMTETLAVLIDFHNFPLFFQANSGIVS